MKKSFQVRGIMVIGVFLQKTVEIPIWLHGDCAGVLRTWGVACGLSGRFHGDAPGVRRLGSLSLT
jgi:hypothetical protein